MNGTGYDGRVGGVWSETDGVVWKETLDVPVDDEGWEALESFQSLERLASWVLECRNLVVEMEQRVELVLKCQA